MVLVCWNYEIRLCTSHFCISHLYVIVCTEYIWLMTIPNTKKKQQKKKQPYWGKINLPTLRNSLYKKTKLIFTPTYNIQEQLKTSQHDIHDTQIWVQQPQTGSPRLYLPVRPVTVGGFDHNRSKKFRTQSQNWIEMTKDEDI